MAVKDVQVNTERTGVYGNELMAMLNKLESNKDLQRIYEGKVLESIAVLADNNELRIEDASSGRMKPEDEKKFLEILASISGQKTKVKKKK